MCEKYKHIGYFPGLGNPVLVVVFALVALASDGQIPCDWKTTTSNLKYQLFKASRLEIGDRLTCDLICKTDKDSVLFNSRNSENGFTVPLVQPEYPGDIYEGLSMHTVGDIGPHSTLIFEVKLVGME